jgi:hypothetical protein
MSAASTRGTSGVRGGVLSWIMAPAACLPARAPVAASTATAVDAAAGR